MGLAPSSQCNFCNEKENPEHRLINCVRARTIWLNLELKTGGKVENLKDIFDLDFEFESRTLKLELISLLLNDNKNTADNIWKRSLKFIASIQNYSIYAEKITESSQSSL